MAEKRQQKGRDFEDILAELKASEGGKHYSPSARTKLFNEFIRHAKADPLEVRTLLERPPEDQRQRRYRQAANASPLESVIIDRIACAWLHAHLCDLAVPDLTVPLEL